MTPRTPDPVVLPTVELAARVIVPDLDLVAVVASTDAAGAADPQVYLELVSTYIAPAIDE